MENKEILGRLREAYIAPDKLTKEELRELLRDSGNLIAELEAEAIAKDNGNKDSGNGGD